MTQAELFADAEPLAHRAGRMFVCALNPSTADAIKPDPTLTRLMIRAAARRYDVRENWGATITGEREEYRYTLTRGQLDLGNLFGLRSTNPLGLLEVADPVGPENDEHLMRLALGADLVVCGWGVQRTPKRLRELVERRAAHVERMFRAAGIELHVFGLTEDGVPRHPLFMPLAVGPERWAT